LVECLIYYIINVHGRENTLALVASIYLFFKDDFCLRK